MPDIPGVSSFKPIYTRGNQFTYLVKITRQNNNNKQDISRIRLMLTLSKHRNFWSFPTYNNWKRKQETMANINEFSLPRYFLIERWMVCSVHVSEIEFLLTINTAKVLPQWFSELGANSNRNVKICQH